MRQQQMAAVRRIRSFFTMLLIFLQQARNLMILLSAIKKEFLIRERIWRLMDMLLMIRMEAAACSS